MQASRRGETVQDVRTGRAAQRTFRILSDVLFQQAARPSQATTKLLKAWGRAQPVTHSENQPSAKFSFSVYPPKKDLGEKCWSGIHRTRLEECEAVYGKRKSRLQRSAVGSSDQHNMQIRKTRVTTEFPETAFSYTRTKIWEMSKVFYAVFLQHLLNSSQCLLPAVSQKHETYVMQLNIKHSTKSSSANSKRHSNAKETSNCPQSCTCNHLETFMCNIMRKSFQTW